MTSTKIGRRCVTTAPMARGHGQSSVWNPYQHSQPGPERGAGSVGIARIRPYGANVSSVNSSTSICHSRDISLTSEREGRISCDYVIAIGVFRAAPESILFREVLVVRGVTESVDHFREHPEVGKLPKRDPRPGRARTALIDAVQGSTVPEGGGTDGVPLPQQTFTLVERQVVPLVLRLPEADPADQFSTPTHRCSASTSSQVRLVCR